MGHEPWVDRDENAPADGTGYVGSDGTRPLAKGAPPGTQQERKRMDVYLWLEEGGVRSACERYLMTTPDLSPPSVYKDTLPKDHDREIRCQGQRIQWDLVR